MVNGIFFMTAIRSSVLCFSMSLRKSGIGPLAIPPKSPNLNDFGERWVGSIRRECLSKLILFGEVSLRRALNGYIAHYHSERNHQGGQPPPVPLTGPTHEVQDH